MKLTSKTSLLLGLIIVVALLIGIWMQIPYEFIAGFKATPAGMEKHRQLVDQSLLAFQKGDYQEALRLKKMVEQYQPAEKYGSKVDQAYLLFKLNRKTEAMELLHEVISANSTYRETAINMRERLRDE